MDIFGEVMDRSAREQLWGQVQVGQALALLSGMLRDLDLGDVSPASVEAGWVSVLPRPAVTRAREALRDGRRLLPPQLLLVSMMEALRFCPAGSARDDLSDLDVVLRAVWSIADSVGQLRDEAGPRWGGLEASLAAEMMANQYFNVGAYPVPLFARAEVTWRSGWASSVDPQLQTLAGGTPAELFAEATKCDLDSFFGVAVHLWVQAQQHRYLRFPPEFFRRIGIDPAAVDRFLDATSVSLADLQAHAASYDAAQQPWAFNELRTHPIVQLPDGSVQVIRLGYVLERAFGQVPEFDVRKHLGKMDGSTGLMTDKGREQAFRSSLNKQFEHSVGSTLWRIFPATGVFKQIYTEDEMWGAWWIKRDQPSVSDWVVDCGNVWLCLDANNRRLSQALVRGFASPDDLNTEVSRALAGRKASQMASTIDLLTEQLPLLASGRTMPPDTKFVPLIVVPEDGLPWNPAVHNRVQEITKGIATLQSDRVMPLGVVTLHDLGFLERAVEDGHDAGGLVTAWRSESPEIPLQHFLDTRGVPLRRPQFETDAFQQLTDELLEQMTRHLEEQTEG
ncbi:hypothetical protein OHA21_38710 [Actinoplanes sp. NBC_00393]|uniref:hypothetical protein n=1 Tax=Actinoplanes sp. NBC_00393 TaxID=2975953 RepID=UPI002E1F3B34